MSTHEVLNQPPPLVDYNVFSADRALVDGVCRGSAAWAIELLTHMGELAGSDEWQQRAALANTYAPVLRTHDRFGNRIDEVEFHLAWHELMTAAVSFGIHASPWRERVPGAHVARAAAFL